MGISIFPSTAAEFVSNNFVVDMNDTTNNTVTLENIKQAGTYNIAIESGDTSFDIYLLDSDGALVAYTNTTTVAAPGLFQIVVILGVADSEVISFSYAGTVNNADGEGDQPGAGAYLESISPADLPSFDDTATVIGGNFGANTEITFESGATVLPAKSITVVSGTELLVTRPDGLVEDDSPYDLKAINTGVTPPSSINFVLTDAVTAGSDPTFVTTSPLNTGIPGVAFSQTLEATDTDGTVVDYSVTAGTLTTGLSLDSSSGVLSGTPTSGGNFVFTVTATDDGGNSTAREFEHSVEQASGGTVFTEGGFVYHLFTSTDDLVVNAEITDAEYLVVAGGGGGGQGQFGDRMGGGGGAGGLLNGTTTLSAGTITCTVGGGGSGNQATGSPTNSNGANSSLGAIATAIGGGKGGFGNTTTIASTNGSDGGSGGGAGGTTETATGGSGTAGQGQAGGDHTSGDINIGSGGGGAGQVGGDTVANVSAGDGGDGLQFSAWATATGTGADGGYYAGGGAGSASGNPDECGQGGLGGGGTPINLDTPDAGTANTGGGGSSEAPGGSGIIIVRYAA